MGEHEGDYGSFTRGEWGNHIGRAGSGRAPRAALNRRPRLSLVAAAAVSVIASAILGWSGLTSYLRIPQAPKTILDPARIFTTSSFPRAATTPTTTTSSRPIEIRWRTTDLAPAATAGHICVTDRVSGQICADYAVGERPADTLTRSLERLGLRVQTDG